MLDFARKAILGTALALPLALTVPMTALASTCDVGTCVILDSSEGQTLTDSNVLFWNVQNIVNDGGSFNFFTSFVTGTLNDASGSVSVLQFNPAPGFGLIADLVLTVFAPGSISPQTYTITDSTGAAVGPVGNTVPFSILGLDTLPIGTSVFFELQGNAIPSGNVKPGFQVTISAVPLPAGGLLLFGALGGLAALRRRKTA